MFWDRGRPARTAPEARTSDVDVERVSSRFALIAGETPAILKMITLRPSHLADVVAHARETNPAECCGLIGGASSGHAQTIYRLRNVSANNQVSYEVAPEELFAAQREMRQRGEELVAIYHSHPRASEPEPSETDVRLAYYPSATYLIIGLGGPAPVMRAFKISEAERRWERVEYAVADA